QAHRIYASQAISRLFESSPARCAEYGSGTEPADGGRGLYGLRKRVQRIGLAVDDPARLIASLAAIPLELPKSAEWPKNPVECEYNDARSRRMTIRFACLSCGKKLHTDDKNCGRSTHCPACSGAVTVPAASTRPEKSKLGGPKLVRPGSHRRKKAGVSRRDLQLAREFYETAEGTSLERYCIAGLMLAAESEEIAEQRRQLTPDSEKIFMMTYHCCMMWAIKRNLESELDREGVQSAVRAMQS